ncbi:Cupin domain protein [Halogranum gelatinilyticum]|uniref:Cupin domain protein n=2 Tax=Halogranum gelatinilyticum TaxID=660521 RepID=A0A1G9UE66_9EURY|nr:Cupin domain protein [Halogranum gelatinilyticum]
MPTGDTLNTESREDALMERVTHDDVDTVAAIEGVHLTQMAAGEKMSVQEFVIDPGAAVEKHDHPHEQTGYIVEGTLTFVVDGEEEIVVGPGDSYVIPGEEPHAAENRGDETVVGVDIFSPPRTNAPWEE